MKQETPLHKKDKWRHVDFSQIQQYLNKPTPAQLDARRRETDKVSCTCDDASQCWEPCGELGHSEQHVRVVGGWDAATEDLTTSHKVNPIRDAAQAFIAGMGIGVAVVAIIFGLVGANPLPYALGAVVCLLGYLYLDGE